MKRRLSKTNKTNNNVKQLLNLLSSENEYTMDDLRTALNTKSRATVYSLFDNLEDMGIPIIKTKKGRICYFSLKQNPDSDICQYNPINKKTIINQAIIDYVKSGKQRKRVVNTLEYDKDNPNKTYMSYSFVNDTYEIQQQKTSTYDTINHLVEIGELENSNSILTPTGKTIPLYLELDESELLDLSDKLTALPDNTPFSEELSSIRTKTKILMDELNAEEEPNIFLTYGRDYQKSGSLQSRLSILNNTKYKDYAVRITYKSKKGNAISKTVNIINIVYVTENDTLYLITKSVNKPNDYITILLDTILEITTTDIPNSEYSNPADESMFQQMLKIDTGQPIDITLKFRKANNLYENLSQICQQRQATAKLSEIESEDQSFLIYTDTIRGLNDFARLLRRFSNLCTDIAPDELKEKLFHTAQVSCSRYEEIIQSEQGDNGQTESIQI